MTSHSRSEPWYVLAVSAVGLVFLLLPAHAENAPADGASLFKTKCAMCHGPDGTGKTPMGQKLNIRDLRSAEVQKQSDSDLAHVIGQGKARMPAFGKKLSEDQIKVLVTYLRELGKK